MTFSKTLCALALLSTTAGLMALKVLPSSPIYICTNKGIKQGTREFDECIKQEQSKQELKLSGYQTQYGPNTGIVPPHLRNQ